METCLHSTFTWQKFSLHYRAQQPDHFVMTEIHSTDSDWYCLCHISSPPSWPISTPSILFGKSAAKLFSGENDSAKNKKVFCWTREATPDTAEAAKQPPGSTEQEQIAEHQGKTLISCFSQNTDCHCFWSKLSLRVEAATNFAGSLRSYKILC